jgi:hypothetical protein
VGGAGERVSRCLASDGDPAGTRYNNWAQERGNFWIGACRLLERLKRGRVSCSGSGPQWPASEEGDQRYNRRSEKRLIECLLACFFRSRKGGVNSYMRRGALLLSPSVLYRTAPRRHDVKHLLGASCKLGGGEMGTWEHGNMGWDGMGWASKLPDAVDMGIPRAV